MHLARTTRAERHAPQAKKILKNANRGVLIRLMGGFNYAFFGRGDWGGGWKTPVAHLPPKNSADGSCEQ